MHSLVRTGSVAVMGASVRGGRPGCEAPRCPGLADPPRIEVASPQGRGAAMKIGLVLGGGGVTGAAWLIGALDAIESETGWRGSDADRIIGTSAGAVVGALVAGGVAPAEMGACAAAAPLRGYARAERAAGTLAERLGRVDLRPAGLPSLGPGS